MLEVLTGTTWGILLLAFIGMALIVTEFLVKTKGIAGVIGLGSLAMYFYGTTGNSDYSSWMLGLFVIGLLLMVVDGKLIQDGTLATVGVVLMLIAMVVPTNDLALGAGVACAVILGLLTSMLSFRIFPKRDMWERMTLRDRLTKEKGYSTINESFTSLVGKRGVVTSTLRPSGIIEVEGKRYDAISNGTWVQQGTAIEVVSVDGTRILVNELETVQNG